MSHSIEMGQNFHKLRRLAKIIAPDFRIFATEELQPGQCVLDMKQKTIEVGERTGELQSAAAVLFQLGHLRLKDDTRYAEHFGRIQIENEKILVKRLIKQGIEVDKKALEWAVDVLVGTWNLEADRAKSLVEPYVWDTDMWEEYYAGS